MRLAYELRQSGHRFPIEAQPIPQIVPKRDAEFVAGLEQRQEGVAVGPTNVTARPT